MKMPVAFAMNFKNASSGRILSFGGWQTRLFDPIVLKYPVTVQQSKRTATVLYEIQCSSGQGRAVTGAHLGDKP